MNFRDVMKAVCYGAKLAVVVPTAIAVLAFPSTANAGPKLANMTEIGIQDGDVVLTSQETLELVKALEAANPKPAGYTPANKGPYYIKIPKAKKDKKGKETYDVYVVPPHIADMLFSEDGVKNPVYDTASQQTPDPQAPPNPVAMPESSAPASPLDLTPAKRGKKYRQVFSAGLAEPISIENPRPPEGVISTSVPGQYILMEGKKYFLPPGTTIDADNIGASTPQARPGEFVVDENNNIVGPYGFAKDASGNPAIIYGKLSRGFGPPQDREHQVAQGIADDLLRAAGNGTCGRPARSWGQKVFAFLNGSEVYQKACRGKLPFPTPLEGLELLNKGQTGINIPQRTSKTPSVEIVDEGARSKYKESTRPNPKTSWPHGFRPLPGEKTPTP